MIAELREERARLDEAIVSLERLSHTETPRRGRPPAWTKAVGETAPRSGNGDNSSSNGSALPRPED